MNEVLRPEDVKFTNRRLTIRDVVGFAASIASSDISDLVGFMLSRLEDPTQAETVLDMGAENLGALLMRFNDSMMEPFAQALSGIQASYEAMKMRISKGDSH